ncbi:MAG: non-canonical purine NTP pyrophosphatase [Anaerolineae bacterium]|nr:non-canonical purine NTP pyrophosphatase [Anaerolineae bacterium]
MTRQLLYATSNPGKVMEVRKIFESLGLPMQAPADVGLALDVPETGASLEDNARQKAQAYLDRLGGGDYVVIGDDTGVEIDALNGEPGIHVRRWIGRPMTDQEIIDHCLARLADVPPGQRGAQFRTVFALGVPGGALELYDGTLRGVILPEADDLRIEGFPFESIFYVPEWDMLLGKAHQLPTAAKARFVTHRERALRAALPRIRALLDGRQ